MNDDDTLITSDEVIALLQVNRRTLYRLIQGRAFPAQRVGRHWRFRKGEILRWLHRRGQHPKPATSTNPRVLLVDDDETARRWMQEALTSMAMDVDSAADGRAGLDRFNEDTHDLVVVDLRMPGLDGLSVIRHIRQRAPVVPIIVVTGYSTEASAIEALNLGVSRYLTKPFRLPQLVEAVNVALKRSA